MTMEVIFDVVDLLQLEEVWVRRSIVKAFSRLAYRQSDLPSTMDFSLDWLMPRLAQFRVSSDWQREHPTGLDDPGDVPMCSLSDACLQALYPDVVPAAAARQTLFASVYNHFVVAQYRGEENQTTTMLRALVRVRNANLDDCLDAGALPRQGASDWIPTDLTDEIRGLDGRYDASEPGTPAAYVVSDSFWGLLVKAKPEDIESAVRLCCPGDEVNSLNDFRSRLVALVDVANVWHRSPSVVGLHYQVMLQPSAS